MGYFDLADYYKVLFSLQQFHNWPMFMVEQWTPNDREVWLYMLSEHIEEEKAKQKQGQG